jgi:curved DNA-binding protein CbpA
MDYYEELGIKPSATPEEIHRAHRRLSKLLHPDQQTDDDMKLLAETQMRRVNALVEILADPELRHQYDDQLKGTMPPPAVPNGVAGGGDKWNLPFGRIRRRLLPWWMWTTLAAVVLTIGVVWFWADHLGSSFSNETQAYSRPSLREQEQPTSGHAGSRESISDNKRSQSAATEASRVQSATQAPAADGPVVRPGSAQIDKLADGNGSGNKPLKAGTHVSSGAGTRVANASRQYGENSSRRESPSLLPKAKSASPQAKQMASKSKNETTERNQPNRLLAKNDVNVAEAVQMRTDAANLPPPPIVAVNESSEGIPVAVLPLPRMPVATGVVRRSVERHDPLAGEWEYAPKEPEKRKSGFYSPEFIHLQLFWDEGALRGKYQARYHVTDRPISPDVSFLLSPMDPESRKFIWQSSNGSRGTLKIRPIDPGTIRVEWRTTVPSRAPALSTGTATLVRRAP